MDDVKVQVLPDGRVARADAAKFLGYRLGCKRSSRAFLYQRRDPYRGSGVH